MIIDGEEVFDQAPREVWDALHDPRVLEKAIPGCKSITDLGSGSYSIKLSLGVAAVRGDYEGKIRVIDDRSLSHYRIEGQGTGAPGFVKTRMECWFENRESGTLMKWKCEATVGGLVASIGGRVLSGTSKFLAKQFFSAFREQLTGTSTGGKVPEHGSAAAADATQPSVASGRRSLWAWLLRLFRGRPRVSG